LHSNSSSKAQATRAVWYAIGWLGIVAVSVGLALELPETSVLRFADTTSQSELAAPLMFSAPEPSAPEVPAAAWLQQHGWEKVWPKLFLGRAIELTFAGPPTQRYLRLSADRAYAVWAHPLTVEPHQWPLLEITWAVERFPEGAALDIHGRNDRALAVIVSFGPKVPSGGLRPDVPRGLAFFWGETETVGANYTCITPRQGPANEPLQCVYPHVKYIALRSGGAGTVQTDRVNLVELFQQQFPDYWQEHQQVPPVVGVSFEARADRTASHSIARLYALAFRPANAWTATK
jgi:hypothetical protein